MADVLVAETRVSLVSATKVKHLCTACGSRWKGTWGGPVQKVVVANVYEGGRWVRTLAWHLRCYEEAGSPFGSPEGRREKG